MLRPIGALVGSLLYERIINPVYKKKLAEYVAALCGDGFLVLDVGCNDGTVSKAIIGISPTVKIVGIDIQANRPSAIERTLYDGKKIPFPDNNFDVVMALDVLHHTESPAALLNLLKEMRRVSKRYVIIKDHIARSIVSRWALCLCDILANLPFNVRCTFNYLTEKQWEECFRVTGLEVVERPRKIHFGFGVTERYNPIFKLEKVTS